MALSVLSVIFAKRVCVHVCVFGTTHYYVLVGEKKHEVLTVTDVKSNIVCIHNIQILSCYVETLDKYLN